MNDLPAPVGPVISKLWWAATQPDWARLMITERSSPRGARKSMSSTVASWRSLAALRRSARRRLSRASASRSTSKPEAFVEAQAQVLALLELFAQTERHAEQPQRVEFVEGLVDQHASGLQQRLLVVGRSAQIGMVDRHDLRRCVDDDRHAVQAVLQDGVDAAVRDATGGQRPLAGGRSCARDRSV